MGSNPARGWALSYCIYPVRVRTIKIIKLATLPASKRHNNTEQVKNNDVVILNSAVVAALLDSLQADGPVDDVEEEEDGGKRDQEDLVDLGQPPRQHRLLRGAAVNVRDTLKHKSPKNHEVPHLRKVLI